ncbi:MAG: cytochrome c oxidase subunit II [Chloroflexi bacterium]|nr:cytochrome c oxidase subunit II [Chloroflexota bacterium]MCI0580694.1 cytochrome c oxidase subunit II [Chloroflexota bacterium]MCI0648575.1 cytochrome c oxidase subunit II [Chloroflexota bacterium]MCI0727338.1 cytochrome c oxidase subunit II [Chloroflexota bacterium]
MGGIHPEASTFAGPIDQMFMVVLIVTSVAFVLVEGTLLYFLIRYRQRQGQKAAYIHGNRRVEAAWTIIPGMMLFGLAVFQYNTWVRAKLFLPAESDALVVGVSSNQFEWEATYPGADGALDTADDVKAPINILHFPVNRPVIIRLESEDVLHSFWIPALRVKQDAIPGREIELWFEATLPGEYELACAELCGLGHYRMRGRVTIESESEFAAWLAELAE